MRCVNALLVFCPLTDVDSAQIQICVNALSTPSNALDRGRQNNTGAMSASGRRVRREA
jgi:hypothetical protein